MNVESKIISEYASQIASYYANEDAPRLWYPMFYKGRKENRNKYTWVKENNKMFLHGTPNEILCNRWFGCELGAISAMTYSTNGLYIIVGHTSGMIQAGYLCQILCSLLILLQSNQLVCYIKV